MCQDNAAIAPYLGPAPHKYIYRNLRGDDIEPSGCPGFVKLKPPCWKSTHFWQVHKKFCNAWLWENWFRCASDRTFWLKKPLTITTKLFADQASVGISTGFETLGKRHQKSKTGVLVATENGLMSSKFLKINCAPIRSECSSRRVSKTEVQLMILNRLPCRKTLQNLNGVFRLSSSVGEFALNCRVFSSRGNVQCSSHFGIFRLISWIRWIWKGQW